MKEFWNTLQLTFTVVGGCLGYFLGGCDGLILALLLFVVTDYITGVMCAAVDKKFSSSVGFKGIFRGYRSKMALTLRLCKASATAKRFLSACYII